jgi:hypothetical protein
MDKLLTVVVPEEIHNKLAERKEKTGASISFQVNEILKEAVCKSQKSRT